MRRQLPVLKIRGLSSGLQSAAPVWTWAVHAPLRTEKDCANTPPAAPSPATELQCTKLFQREWDLAMNLGLHCVSLGMSFKTFLLCSSVMSQPRKWDRHLQCSVGIKINAVVILKKPHFNKICYHWRRATELSVSTQSTLSWPQQWKRTAERDDNPIKQNHVGSLM